MQSLRISNIRDSKKKNDYWIQILKLNVGFSFTFYIRDLKTNHNVELSLIINIRE